MPGFLIPIGVQFFDDVGDPLSGGKLYTFDAGTSTPKAIYTTENLNVAHSNPAILDAAGRLTAFVSDGEGYKYRLMDADDVLVREWDEVAVPEIEAPAVAAEVPTGGLIMYGGTAAPSGWLMCDGSAVSRTTYADLFSAIGTTFGAGNGTTTFNLPDLRQRFPIGKAASGTGSTLGGSGGTIDHVHSGPSHTHSIGAHTHTMAHTHSVPVSGYTRQTGAASSFPSHVLMSDGGGGGVSVPNADGTSGAASSSTTSSQALTTDASGSGDTGSANPPFQAVNFIIKT